MGMDDIDSTVTFNVCDYASPVRMALHSWERKLTEAHTT